MANYETVAIIISLIVGVIGTLAVVFPLAKKKGINTGEILKDVEEGAEDVENVINAAQEIVPSKALNVLDLVDKLALKATKAARQMYISSQLPLDQRKISAKNAIIAGLKAFNIPITANLDVVIDMAIEKCVIDTKTPDEIIIQENGTTQKIISELQKQIADLQATNANLTQANTELTNKVNIVQNTVTPALTNNVTVKGVAAQ